MLKAIKYELRPTTEQKNQLNQAIGACRFIYNLALETKIAAYQSGKNVSCFDLMKTTELKNKKNKKLCKHKQTKLPQKNKIQVTKKEKKTTEKE